MDGAKQQTKLNQYLRDLSTCLYKDEELIDKSRILLGIYANNFRHSYSSILGVIIDIKRGEDSPDQPSASLDYLAENVSLLNNVIIERAEFRCISASLNKLYDHVMLEISRLSHIESLNGMRRDLDKKLLDGARQVDEATNDLKNTVKVTENLKSEMITVIGIFAAIMLSFVGGMNFTSATLTSIGQSSIYKITFITIICGFTIFNTIFCLIYLIARMTDKNIYSYCKDGEGECITAKCEKDCGLGKIRKRLPFVYWVNRIMLIGIIITFFSWFFDIKIIAESIQSWMWNKLN